MARALAGYVGPLSFLCTRSFIGGAALLPVIAFMDRQKSEEARLEEKKPENRKILIRGGILCGLALCFASAFQQYGILFTTVGKAGFITACYIVLVPIAGDIFGKRCGINVWIGVILAVGGLTASYYGDPADWDRRYSGVYLRVPVCGCIF